MGNKQKWYTEKHYYGWTIENNLLNVLDPLQVGEEQAEENAKLCASAPELLELLKDMQLWLESYSTTINNKNHPVFPMLEKYYQLEQEYGL